MIIQDYYPVARENEEVFRNVLRDLRDCRNERPMGYYVPENLETEASLEEIFKKYSEGERSGIFTICDFSMPDARSAKVVFRDIAPLSGGGANLSYLVHDDGSVEYQKSDMVIMS